MGGVRFSENNVGCPGNLVADKVTNRAGDP